ncbi:MAG: T9SS type A sorting domain-containing protein [Cyclobacteriaceae bacterium]
MRFEYFFRKIMLCLLTTLIFYTGLARQTTEHSVARKWNEALLVSIRNDFARPTVHARNLFHTSIALYDAWAVYDEKATPFLLGQTVGSFNCSFEGVEKPENITSAREEAMSYAANRLLQHRFEFSPGADESLSVYNDLMDELGHDILFTSLDYSNGSAAALGNYIANCIIDFGKQDNSNEFLDYRNEFYEPVNPAMDPTVPGSQGATDPNRWQPLSFDFFIDQSGNLISGNTPDFLGPEWGRVIPFALTANDLTVYERDGNEYWVYHDPGMPAYLESDGSGMSAEYQWGYSLVSIWSSQLDPSDGVMWDISPGSIGNIPDLPTTISGYREFYDLFEGGDISLGHDVNPKTDEPYPPQMVPRGDYGRVLAEFWADGPESETPPGHWFTILNKVNDSPDLEKRFKGEGEILDDLEWDVKAYFVLAGTMHDAAVSSWGIKGWYDYVRPISAIRFMADQGQSSDPNLSSYAPNGIPLEEGLIELVEEGDPLAGNDNEHVGKIKLYAWKGPEFISDPEVDQAGVGWILAENWWPYQRPTFVTPPFAGYISGHSTFSRAAAEVITMLTGDEYFPGGVGEFVAKKNEFLVFEEGPSVDVVLQWATYRDASDQTSLSRIWGGIHPPVDDIPGRLIGVEIGNDAFALAERYFNGNVVTAIADNQLERSVQVYPNPSSVDYLTVKLGHRYQSIIELQLMSMEGKLLLEKTFPPVGTINIDVRNIPSGTYLISISGDELFESRRIVIE